MAERRNTKAWVTAWGDKLIQVAGSVDKDKAIRYSAARYRTKTGIFEVYAFFETEGEYDAFKVQKRIGPELKEIFKAERYLCVVERLKKRKREKDKMRLEFYAKCPLPEPSDVARINEVVKAAVEEEKF